MASLSIQWHENCLKNRNINLEAKLKELQRLQEYCDKFSMENFEYQLQIAKAKKRNLPKFDRERFMKSRNSSFTD
jgi:hypothetical protein